MEKVDVDQIEGTVMKEHTVGEFLHAGHHINSKAPIDKAVDNIFLNLTADYYYPSRDIKRFCNHFLTRALEQSIWVKLPPQSLICFPSLCPVRENQDSSMCSDEHLPADPINLGCFVSMVLGGATQRN